MNIKIKKQGKYKFCILAAGKGTRNTSVCGLHKALLPLENKATISHIIRSVPKDIEVVIAIGYKHKQVQSYVQSVFFDRNIKFVYVENYDGEGSGPGYSLLQCKEFLQTPFIFTSADTIIKEAHMLDKLEENWLGVSRIDPDESSKYCLVDGKKYLDKLYYGHGSRAYIGMAGVYDYKSYWKHLEDGNYTHGEYQVISGFNGLQKIKLLDFTWFDTGNNQSYNHARKNFANEIVAVKNKEVVFIEDNKVIKYFDDSKKIDKRIERVEYLCECSPDVIQINENMYSYDYIKGNLLSKVLDENVLKDVLYFYKNKFASTQYEKTDNFLKDCKKMYYDKTINRIKPFANTYLDKIEYINGIKVEGINNLIKKIDWDSIYNTSIPSNFHGDFQPENIIYNGKTFKLIDWRDSFGDSISIGDFYYDLGKLYHALLINGQVVLSKGYDYSIKNNQAYVEYNIKNNLFFLVNYFEDFCNENDLKWDNVMLLGILQYIGICSLYKDFHNGKYGEFLFLLGKCMLTKFLNRTEQ
jgi:dTDP-glucose pyrophosphorylase